MLALLCKNSNQQSQIRPTYPRSEVDFSQYRAAAPEAVERLLGRIGLAFWAGLASFGPVGFWSILQACGVV